MKLLDHVDYVRGPYTRKSGREIIHVHTKDGRHRLVTYARFLVETVLGRELDPVLETVDHIDGNFCNNVWNNLRLVDLAIHSSEDRIRVQRVPVRCVWCNAPTTKAPSQIEHKLREGYAGPFCGKRCAGLYGAAVQNRALPKSADYYMRWNHYRVSEPTYYTVTKLGETVADMALRFGKILPTPDEIRQALPRREPRKFREEHPCTVCGVPTKRDKYCSITCSAKSQQRTERPTPERLAQLVWEQPTTHIAKMFKVSDAAVAKWCKKYGIEKPPRGYWAKQQARGTRAGDED